ncbi:hypothetical protein PR048_011228 [Dryococelus australis]|uniref:Uncharacterized protein n=1 Tax=Dryococelus australis TaxID=614101 RepID=A0ABQ9HL14_9NEOP|nr:hypothetical protein PR048_011228 [Dryococelus australis]
MPRHGNIECFVGTAIKLVDNKIELCQHQLIEKMLKRFNLQECKVCLTPMEDKIEVNDTDDVINFPYRELTYLSQISRPDITFAIILEPFSGLSNMPLVKGTIDKNLVYKKHPEECAQVFVYADADWGGNKTDCKV